MISFNYVIAIACAVALVAAGATVAILWGLGLAGPCRAEHVEELTCDEMAAELDAKRADEGVTAPLAQVHAMRAGPAVALASGMHPAGVIAGEVTDSWDWAPTDRLEAWTHTGAPKTPGRERGEVRAPAHGPAAPPATRPGGPPEPLRVILARFREDLDASTAEFDRHMDELVAA